MNRRKQLETFWNHLMVFGFSGTRFGRILAYSQGLEVQDLERLSPDRDVYGFTGTGEEHVIELVNQLDRVHRELQILEMVAFGPLQRQQFGPGSTVHGHRRIAIRNFQFWRSVGELGFGETNRTLALGALREALADWQKSLGGAKTAFERQLDFRAC